MNHSTSTYILVYVFVLNALLYVRREFGNFFYEKTSKLGTCISCWEFLKVSRQYMVKLKSNYILLVFPLIGYYTAFLRTPFAQDVSFSTKCSSDNIVQRLAILKCNYLQTIILPIWCLKHPTPVHFNYTRWIINKFVVRLDVRTLVFQRFSLKMHTLLVLKPEINNKASHFRQRI